MRKVCNEVMRTENSSTPCSLLRPDDDDPPVRRSSLSMTYGNRAITLKLKRSEYHIRKEKDIVKFWLVDSLVMWDLVRFRVIRNTGGSCMAEGLLPVRHSPNSQLYGVLQDDNIGVNRSVAVCFLDSTDHGLESNINADIVYTASSSCWVTPDTPLSELQLIRGILWGDTRPLDDEEEWPDKEDSEDPVEGTGKNGAKEDDLAVERLPPGDIPSSQIPGKPDLFFVSDSVGIRYGTNEMGDRRVPFGKRIGRAPGSGILSFIMTKLVGLPQLQWKQFQADWNKGDGAQRAEIETLMLNSRTRRSEHRQSTMELSLLLTSLTRHASGWTKTEAEISLFTSRHAEGDLMTLRNL